MLTYQKNFITIISQRLPEGEKLVDYISKVIHIGREASYRRIRCEVEFSLSEVVIIAKELNINLTSLVLREGGEKVTCNLRSIQEGNLNKNLAKLIEADLNVLEGFEKRANLCLHIVTHSIPDFLLFRFPLLFKLKALKNQFAEDTKTPVSFGQLTISDDIIALQTKYWNELTLFDLEVIISQNMFMPFINDIHYFVRFGLISSVEAIQLQDELVALLEVINEIGRSGTYLNKSIKLYCSPFVLDMTHTLVSSDSLAASIVNLPYTNSILSFDTSFNAANLSSYQLIKKSAMLITQSGELERFEFIEKQRKIIRAF